MPNICACCKIDFSDDFCTFSWSGPPFAKNSPVKLCPYCGYAIKPRTSANIAFIGTSDNDVYSWREMKDDGFIDKKRVVRSIKAVGKAIGLPKKVISSKLK
jgi:hypothetical protein